MVAKQDQEDEISNTFPCLRKSVHVEGIEVGFDLMKSATYLVVDPLEGAACSNKHDAWEQILGLLRVHCF